MRTAATKFTCATTERRSASRQGRDLIETWVRRIDSRLRLHGGEANGRYSHGLFTAEAIEERKAFLKAIERNAK